MRALILLLTIGCVSATCPTEWVSNMAGTKCFLIAPLLRVDSMWDQEEFCTNIGGQIVEPRTVDELSEIKAIAASFGRTDSTAADEVKWTDGAWLNYITLNDNRVLSATTLTAPADGALSKELDALFVSTSGGDVTHGCLGFFPNGTVFNFDVCLEHGNPFCEMTIGGLSKNV